MSRVGKILKPNEKPQDEFSFITDEKIRKTFILMLGKFNEKEKEVIRRTYGDRKLLQKYEDIRNSGVFQHPVGQAARRKLLEFPNHETWRFADTVMTQLYGDDWLYDNRALRHELVRPFLVVKKI